MVIVKIEKEQAEKLGVNVAPAIAKEKFFLREDSCVIDDFGTIRFVPFQVLSTVGSIKDLKPNGRMNGYEEVEEMSINEETAAKLGARRTSEKCQLFLRKDGSILDDSGKIYLKSKKTFSMRRLLSELKEKPMIKNSRGEFFVQITQDDAEHLGVKVKENAVYYLKEDGRITNHLKRTEIIPKNSEILSEVMESLKLLNRIKGGEYGSV